MKGLHLARRLAPIAVATIATVRRSGVEMGTLDPFELGFTRCTIADLKGSDTLENAQIFKQILAGKISERVRFRSGGAGI